MKLVGPLAAFTRDDLALAGGKGANLGELIRAGFPVPDGFLVTAEDLPGAAFAGQQDTYLNAVGEAAVIDAVRRLLGSLWTDRAVAHRRLPGQLRGLPGRVRAPGYRQPDPGHPAHLGRRPRDGARADQRPRRRTTRSRRPCWGGHGGAAPPPAGPRPQAPRPHAALGGAARAGIAFREDSHFHFTKPLPILRRSLLAIGRRLCQAGVPSQPQEVFHLRLEELEDIGDPARLTERHADQLRAAVRARSARREELAGVRLIDPSLLFPHPDRGDTLVSGTPASGGTATGPVISWRVVISSAAAGTFGVVGPSCGASSQADRDEPPEHADAR